MRESIKKHGEKEPVERKVSLTIDPSARFVTEHQRQEAEKLLQEYIESDSFVIYSATILVDEKFPGRDKTILRLKMREYDGDREIGFRPKDFSLEETEEEKALHQKEELEDQERGFRSAA